MNRYTFDDISCAFDDEDLETREFVKASDVVAMESDAQTLRGYINTYGETPAMTWSNREHWKKRAERAEADRDSWRRVAERCETEKQSAEAANKRLVAALEKYGAHLDTCWRRQIGTVGPDPQCDCGFEAILSPPSSWPTNEAESEAEIKVHSATCPRCFLSFTCTGD